MDDIDQQLARRPTRLDSKEDDALLDGLLGSALARLRDEEAEIGSLLKEAHSTPASPPPFNTGILYPLYETTLAYLIFKAWLRTTRAHWEVAYPPDRQPEKGSKLKVDLALYTTALPTATWGFEAKWFVNTQAKMLDLLSQDADRLLRWSALERRFLLAFWSGAATNFEKDWADRCSAMPGKFVAGNGKVAYVEPIWVDNFPADRVDVGPSRAGYFAMAAFHLRTP